MDIEKRPHSKRALSCVTTPRVAKTMEILGVGVTSQYVALSRDEFANVRRLYGFKPEPAAQECRELMQAGANRNAIRHAECDGLRMLAWFAKYVPAGEDPLRYLIQVMMNAGLEVDGSDAEWSMDESEL